MAKSSERRLKLGWFSPRRLHGRRRLKRPPPLYRFKETPPPGVSSTSSLLLADAQRLAHPLRFLSVRSQHSPRPTVSYLRLYPVVCSQRPPSASPAAAAC